MRPALKQVENLLNGKGNSMFKGFQKASQRKNSQNVQPFDVSSTLTGNTTPTKQQTQLSKEDVRAMIDKTVEQVKSELQSCSSALQTLNDALDYTNSTLQESKENQN
jgi:hypothetical protein